MRKSVLRASLSVSCPDLTENDENVNNAAVLEGYVRTESYETLPCQHDADAGLHRPGSPGSGSLAPAADDNSRCVSPVAEARQEHSDEHASDHRNVNGHTKLHRAGVRNTKVDQLSTHVLRLTKENLQGAAGTLRNRDNTISFRFSEPKRQSTSILKCLLGTKQQPVEVLKAQQRLLCRSLEPIPTTMTRAQFERCHEWLRDVERAKCSEGT